MYELNDFNSIQISIASPETMSEDDLEKKFETDINLN